MMHPGTDRCGAKTRSGKECQLPAGFGTDHFGGGRCKHHMGCTPAGRKAGYKDLMRKGTAFYGTPIDVSPGDALLQEVSRTAGHVAYLETRIAEADLVEEQGGDEKLARERAEILRSLYQQERKHLTQVCQIAMHAGVEERAVRVAERWGAELADLLAAILADLQLTAEQRERAPAVVRSHLQVLEGGKAA